MDFKEIKELIKVFDKSELNKLKVKDSDFEISLQKGFDNVNTQSEFISVPSSSTSSSVLVNNNDEIIKNSGSETINSPMVGTFYLSSSPGSPSFVKVGDTISNGSTLCILEAMKIMNEVEAEYDFKLIEILVKDGSPVEYGMPLFLVEKI